METWPTGRLLSTASRLVEHAWIERLAELGLTHAGLVVLHLLSGGPVSQVDLAGAARVQVQTMSRTVGRLEREEFVSRVRDPGDARRLLVSRTDSGSEIWQRARLLESEVFPREVDGAELRSALLQIIRTRSDRWA